METFSVTPELLVAIIGQQTVKLEIQQRQLVALREALTQAQADLDTAKFAAEVNAGRNGEVKTAAAKE